MQKPQQQVRGYVNTIMNSLGKDAALLSKIVEGKSGLPVSGGIALVNMSRESFEAAGLQHVLPQERTIFLDDMLPQSPLSKDASGKNFREFLRTAFPPRFPFEITEKQLHQSACLQPLGFGYAHGPHN